MTRRRSVRLQLARVGVGIRRVYIWFEEKPLVVLVAAAGTTIGVVIALAEPGGHGARACKGL